LLAELNIDDELAIAPGEMPNKIMYLISKGEFIMSIILLTFSKNYLCSLQWKQKRLEGREVDKENFLMDLENGKKIFAFSASKYTFEKKKCFLSKTRM
jgi:hypothetical protein